MSKKKVNHHSTNEKKDVREEEFLEQLQDDMEDVQEKLDEDYEDDAREKEIAELNKKISNLQDMLLRNQAELQNYKRRKDEEMERVLKYKNEELIKQLLNVVDNFERAIGMDDHDLSDEVSKFLAGFKLIYTNMIQILEQFDVKEIVSDGVEFNPEYHHAVMMEHDDSKPAGVVLEVLQKGYLYKDRVVRPAMVKVNE